MTTLPAVFEVMSRACRIGTPDESSVGRCVKTCYSTLRRMLPKIGIFSKSVRYSTGLFGFVVIADADRCRNYAIISRGRPSRPESHLFPYYSVAAAEFARPDHTMKILLELRNHDDHDNRDGTDRDHNNGEG